MKGARVTREKAGRWFRTAWKVVLDCGFWRFWQTVCLSLILVVLLVPRPTNLISYIMGFSLGFSVVHGSITLWKKGLRAFSSFRAFIPYFALYGAVFVSCFFADDFSRASVYCGRYFSLLLIPLVFIGMTPEFFTRERLRIFAKAFVAGMAVAALWKLGVLLHSYLFNPDLARYKALGFHAGIDEFLRFFRVYIQGYRLCHPSFEALFLNTALVLAGSAWIRGDAFFSSLRGKMLGGVCISLFLLVLLAFSSKMAFFAGVFSLFLLLVYAVHRRRYVLAGAGFALVLLLGILFFPVIRKAIVPRFVPMVQSIAVFSGKDSQTRQDDGSFLPRIYCYRLGWEMFKEKPLFGRGPSYGEEFRRRFQEENAGRLDEAHLQYRHPHNQFIALMDSSGLLGLGVFLWLLAKVVRDAWRGRTLFWGVWLLCLLAICMVDTLFSYTVGFVYLCGFHGMLASMLARRKSQAKGTRAPGTFVSS